MSCVTEDGAWQLVVVGNGSEHGMLARWICAQPSLYNGLVKLAEVAAEFMVPTQCYPMDGC